MTTTNGYPDCDDMGLAKEYKLQQEIDAQNKQALMDKAKMTPEAQRIAIAEACGWKFHDGQYMWVKDHQWENLWKP